MDYALRLGRRALGTTAENPPVGCIIVKNEKIVGVGWTQPGGRPHAETQALAMAGQEAHGATAFVTLEPCAHKGRTGPCADALVKAGISRVVTAIEDPDPRVSGAGHAVLRNAGISMQCGLLAEAARLDLAGFLTRVTRKRPYVILKMGISADGKIASAPGKRTPITGSQTKARVHLMRAQCDAVLVGVQTVITDDPELTCRLPGMEARSPIRIVADSNLSIPHTSKLVQTAEITPVWLLSTRKEALGPGIRTITCRPSNQGQVDLEEALAHLATSGINRLLVEGGSVIAQSFLDHDLVDEIQFFQSPAVLGEQGVDAIADMPLSQLDARFKHVAKETLGSDTLTVYERR